MVQKQESLYILDKRDSSTYTEDIKRAIDMVTLDKNQPPKIVGSFMYRAHRYPGDIDMIEFYQGCCTVSSSKSVISKKLQEMATRIKNTRQVYLGDFKAGQDNRLKIDIGRIIYNPGAETVEKLVDYDRQVVIDSLEKFYNKKLISKDDFMNLHQLIKEEPTVDEWKKLSEALRKLYTVRWSIKELLAGKKQLLGNKTLTLKEAVSQGTIVKIDIFTKINGVYTEVTNFFVLSSLNKDGTIQEFTESLPEYKRSLEKEIIQRTEEGKYLKVAKRLWLLAITNDDNDTLKKLHPLFSSIASRLRQITAEMETLVVMLEQLRKPPIKDIRYQIDGFKLRIADLSSNIITETLRKVLLHMVDDILKSDMTSTESKVEVIAKLHFLEETLSIMYNSYAYTYLEAVGLLEV